MPWLILLNFLWVPHCNLSNTGETVLFIGAMWLCGLSQSYSNSKWLLTAINLSYQHTNFSTQSCLPGVQPQSSTLKWPGISCRTAPTHINPLIDFCHISLLPTEQYMDAPNSFSSYCRNSLKNCLPFQWFKIAPSPEGRKINSLGIGNSKGEITFRLDLETYPLSALCTPTSASEHFIKIPVQWL